MLSQLGQFTSGRRRLLGWALCLSFGLVACGPRRVEPPPVPPAGPVEAAPEGVPVGARVYVIDAERSIVTLRVYRAGRLARLGHNHVITSALESGYVWTNGQLATSGFEVRLRVADLVVDDPAAREAAGPDFPGELPDSAREGTRRNMLRPEVLDGEHYPEIVVRGDALRGSWERPAVTARITLKNQSRMLDLPLVIRRGQDELSARGAFRILQSEFGITPFSVGGGALQVGDEVDVAFEIHAVAVTKVPKVSGLQDVQVPLDARYTTAK